MVYKLCQKIEQNLFLCEIFGTPTWPIHLYVLLCQLVLVGCLFATPIFKFFFIVLLV